MNTATRSLSLLFVLAALLLPVQGVLAQSESPNRDRTRIILSSDADFSTSGHVFESTDSIYVLVEAPNLDPVSIVENWYRVRPRHDGDEVEGVLTNNLDGTFTAVLAASDLESDAAAWHMEAELEDAEGRTVKGEANFVIRKGAPHFGVFRVHGEVEAVGERSITVGGQEIQIAEWTKVGVGLRAGLDLDVDRLLGEVVTVLVRETPQGLVAVLVTVSTDGDPDRPLEIEGEVTEISDSTISVAGFFIQVDADTKITWRDFDFEFGALHVGMIVEVHVVPADDGSLLARRIVVEDLGRTQVTVRGEITAIDGEVVAIGGTRFSLAPNTHIFNGEERLNPEDLEVGQRAKAVLVPNEDGSYVALVILVEQDDPRARILISGRIDEIVADALIVGGIRIHVDEETEITDRHGDEVPFEALSVGMIVRVYAVHVPDDGLLAKRVVAKVRIHAHGRIRGEVTAVGDSVIVVEDVRFQVVRFTVFRGGIASLDDADVGQHVLVHFLVLADGSRIALSVAARPNPTDDVVFRGPVDSLYGDVVLVAGTPVAMTAETAIVSEDGGAISAADLAAGMLVAVHAKSGEDGLIAVRIRVLESIILLAPIDGSTGSEMRIAGRTILLDDETLIVGDDNRVLTRAALRAGVEVEVVAVTEESAGKTAGEFILVADRVFVTGNVTATAAQDESGLPNGFELEQNYPNPFNPSTTIAFDVTHSQPVHTSLAVFNLLGQRVATLVSGVLEPGRHQVQWNAVTDGGSRVASGVYLYRLEIGGQAETRSMILLK